MGGNYLPHASSRVHDVIRLSHEKLLLRAPLAIPMHTPPTKLIPFAERERSGASEAESETVPEPLPHTVLFLWLGLCRNWAWGPVAAQQQGHPVSAVAYTHGLHWAQGGRYYLDLGKQAGPRGQGEHPNGVSLPQPGDADRLRG